MSFYWRATDPRHPTKEERALYRKLKGIVDGQPGAVYSDNSDVSSYPNNHRLPHGMNLSEQRIAHYVFRQLEESQTGEEAVIVSKKVAPQLGIPVGTIEHTLSILAAYQIISHSSCG